MQTVVKKQFAGCSKHLDEVNHRRSLSEDFFFHVIARKKRRRIVFRTAVFGAQNQKQTQTCKKPTFSQTRRSKLRQKLCHHYQIRAQTKTNSLNAFRIRIFLFCSYSFGTETINTSIRSRSSLENHTRQSIFRPKGAKNPTLWDGTYLLYKGVPPRVLTPFMIEKNRCKKQHF